MIIYLSHCQTGMKDTKTSAVDNTCLDEIWIAEAGDHIRIEKFDYSMEINQLLKPCAIDKRQLKQASQEADKRQGHGGNCRTTALASFQSLLPHRKLGQAPKKPLQWSSRGEILEKARKQGCLWALPREFFLKTECAGPQVSAILTTHQGIVSLK